MSTEPQGYTWSTGDHTGPALNGGTPMTATEALTWIRSTFILTTAHTEHAPDLIVYYSKAVGGIPIAYHGTPTLVPNYL